MQWREFGRRPLVVPTVALLLGNGAAEALTFSPGWAWGTAVVLFGGGILVGRRWLALSLRIAGCFALGVASALQAFESDLPPPGLYRLEGEVELIAGERIDLAVYAWEGRPVRFRATLWGASDVYRRQRVLVEARIAPVAAAANPGEVDRRLFRERRRALVVGGFARGALVPLNAPSVFELWRARTINRLADDIRRIVGDGAPAALLLALATGKRESLDFEVQGAFAKSGLMHILSVSGLHVGVVAVSIAFVLRFLLSLRATAWSRRRDPRVYATPFAIAVVWFYVWFTGLEAPAMRSALTMSLTLLAIPLVRHSDALNALAGAAFALTILDPASPFDLSTQLSFVAMGALVLVGTVPLPVRSWALRWLVRTLIASAAVTVATAPLIAAYFSQVSIAGIAANLVALPLASAATVLAIGASTLSLVSPLLSTPLWFVAGLSAKGLILTSELFAKLPGATLQLHPLTTTGYALFFAGLLVAAVGRSAYRFAALALPVLVLAFPTGRPSAVTVTFLSVGQGDAIVIAAGGHFAVIDGGGIPDGKDVGAQIVVPYLRYLGAREIELMALSHAHPDHALGLISVAAAMPVRRLWLARDEPRGELVEALLAALVGTKASQVDPEDPPFQLGPARLAVVGPRGPRLPSDSENDRSLVLRLDYQEHSFLFTGDLEAPGEHALDTGTVTVLKAPHHGSRTSSTTELLERTRPKYAVFCVGERNRFGFPHEEIVERYRAAGAQCFRTDKHGAVTFESDGVNLTVRTFPPQLPRTRPIHNSTTERPKSRFADSTK